MATFNFITGQIDGGSITNLGISSVYGTPVMPGATTVTASVGTYPGITGTISGSVGLVYSGSANIGNQVGPKLYFIDGLLVSSSA